LAEGLIRLSWLVSAAVASGTMDNNTTLSSRRYA